MVQYVNANKAQPWYKEIKFLGGDGNGCAAWRQNDHLMAYCKSNCFRVPCYLIRKKHAVASVV